MIVRVKNDECRLMAMDNKEARVIEFLWDKFKRRVANYQRTKAYKKGHWDGYKRFVKRSGKFDTGILPQVVKEIRKNPIDKKIRLEVQDLREHQTEFEPIDLSKEHYGHKLFEWQKQAIRAFSNNKLGTLDWKRGVINAATNSGKSKVFCVLHAHKKSQKRTVITIDETEVFNQHIEDFTENGFDVGYVKGTDFKDGEIIVVMYKSALNRYKDLPEWANIVDNETDLLIVDECHKAAAKVYQTFIDKFKNTPARLFVSGTAFEQSDKLKKWNVVKKSGPPIARVTNAENIDAGISLKPVVHMYRVSTFTHEGNYEEDYKNNVVYNFERAYLINEICHEPGRITLVTVFRIEHGEFLAKIIPDSVFMPAEHPQRTKIYSQFKKGDIKILITTVLKTGANLPKINTLVLAGGQKSKIDIKQWIGRALRKNEKDDAVDIIDFIDKGKYVQAHSYERKSIYEGEQFEVKTKRI